MEVRCTGSIALQACARGKNVRIAILLVFHSKVDLVSAMLDISFLLKTFGKEALRLAITFCFTLHLFQKCVAPTSTSWSRYTWRFTPRAQCRRDLDTKTDLVQR